MGLLGSTLRAGDILVYIVFFKKVMLLYENYSNHSKIYDISVFNYKFRTFFGIL